jgi:hypothetical protein
MHIFPPDSPRHHPGILFAEDFDDLHTPSSHAEPVEPEMFAPIITDEDIADARRDGFEAGQIAARAEAALRLQDAARQSCERVGELALRLAEARETYLHNTVDAAAQLIFAALLATLPSLSARHVGHEILHLVRNTITGLAPDEIMTITVAPDCLAPLRDALATAPRDLARRVSLTSSDAMAQGDARLHWQDGAATRNAAMAEQAIGEILRSLGLLPSLGAPIPRAQATIPDLASPYLEPTHG